MVWTLQENCKKEYMDTIYFATSRRGQRGDWVYIDEIDFMSEYCFDVISAIAIERAEIGITVSSTPNGSRSHFYKMCTQKSMGLKSGILRHY